VNIILFGPPGAGKGTQASYISKKFKLHKVSTGDLLRSEIKKKSNLGNEIKSLLDEGSLVSDKIIENLIVRILTDKNVYNRLIFDGYPRNLVQAESLHSLLEKRDQKISCVFSLKVDKETIIKRILGRQVCTNCGDTFNKYYKTLDSKVHTCNPRFLSQRSDDNESTIVSRYETYLKKTFPILEFYKNQNLLREINGDSEISLIYKEIEHIIASLET
tara:strand:+ start:335 stop:985 length:651 start_codon:yes stop_codon:yes gene_type:complete